MGERGIVVGPKPLGDLVGNDLDRDRPTPGRNEGRLRDIHRDYYLVHQRAAQPLELLQQRQN